MIVRGKRGQLTIFVIFALVIVVGALLVYFFFPNIISNIIPIQLRLSPSAYLRNCVDEEIETGIETLSSQGGYIEPEGSVLSGGNPVKYLCYNAQYFAPCIVQQPLLKAHFEQELSGIVRQKSNECIRKLKDEYENRGYSISIPQQTANEIEIAPESVLVRLNAPTTVRKDTTESFDEFNFVKRSKIYDLLMTATSIIDFESTYGDAETTLYTTYYPNLRVKKLTLTDGTTIYTVEDVTTNEKFTFASRSLAWPGGYGLKS